MKFLQKMAKFYALDLMYYLHPSDEELKKAAGFSHSTFNGEMNNKMDIHDMIVICDFPMGRATSEVAKIYRRKACANNRLVYVNQIESHGQGKDRFEVRFISTRFLQPCYPILVCFHL